MELHLKIHKTCKQEKCDEGESTDKGFGVCLWNHPLGVRVLTKIELLMLELPLAGDCLEVVGGDSF